MSQRPPAGDVAVGDFGGSPGEWDRFVADSGGTFCHLSGWRAVMATLGHSTLQRAATAGGRLVGVHPLVEVRSRLFGHYLVSMPFLNYGGPLGSEPARTALARDARELARAAGADLLELRVRTPLDAGLATSERKITVLLDLPDDPESLWEGLRSKVRSQVRRPQKEGMTTRLGPDQAEPFYRVFARNMRDLGTPVLPFAFFAAMREALADQVLFVTVRAGEEPVAAGCGFFLGGEFEMTWASSLREFNRQAPNMLLYWATMEAAIARGATVFNFGRCTPGGGTHRFKSQWGGSDVPLPCAQWSPRGVDATPSPDRPLFRVATAAWSRLPLAVANRVGPLLARGLP